MEPEFIAHHTKNKPYRMFLEQPSINNSNGPTNLPLPKLILEDLLRKYLGFNHIVDYSWHLYIDMPKVSINYVDNAHNKYFKSIDNVDAWNDIYNILHRMHKCFVRSN